MKCLGIVELDGKEMLRECSSVGRQTLLPALEDCTIPSAKSRCGNRFVKSAEFKQANWFDTSRRPIVGELLQKYFDFNVRQD